MAKSKEIRWKITLNAPLEEVFELISSNQGREVFWAEKSLPTAEGFLLEFASGDCVDCRVLETQRTDRFVFEYFNKSRVEFILKANPKGGTEFEVFEPNCPEAHWLENYAGWVAWLFCLKGAVDFGVILRNKNNQTTWAKGFVDG